MQPWRIWIESKIHNNSIELAQNNTLNSRIFRLCHHSQFWKPWSPRPPVLLSFAFVHQLSAVFIFVASFGFCLLDHKSNQKKTVHMRGPCCFEMVWNLKYMFFFMFFPWSVSGCVLGSMGSSIWQSLSWSTLPFLPFRAMLLHLFLRSQQLAIPRCDAALRRYWPIATTCNNWSATVY